MKSYKGGNSSFKGYALMFASVMTNSSTYIISKLLLNKLSLNVFGIYWFGLGIIWNGLNVWRKWKNRLLVIPSRQALLWLMWIGFIEVIATFSFFNAVYWAPNPSIIAFLNNMAPVFVIILAVIFLNEKLSGSDIIAIGITLAGAVLITGDVLTKPSMLFRSGSGYIIISAMLYAVSTVSMKRNVGILDASLVTFNRSVLMFLSCGIGYLAEGGSLFVRPDLWLLLLLGSVMGPFLTVFLTYSALTYIDASRVSVISTGRLFFVLIGTWMVFGVLPDMHQVWGGLLIVFGIYILTVGKPMVQLWIRRIINL
ncbi:MAG: DMT family transporter [Bacteroidales bacterium]